MFDLRANYVIKVSGKQLYGDEKETTKYERTFFLCVKKDVLDELFTTYPKCKFTVQKRALQRRKVLIEHLEKCEEYLAKNEVVKLARAQKFKSSMKNVHSYADV